MRFVWIGAVAPRANQPVQHFSYLYKLAGQCQTLVPTDGVQFKCSEEMVLQLGGRIESDAQIAAFLTASELSSALDDICGTDIAALIV